MLLPLRILCSAVACAVLAIPVAAQSFGGPVSVVDGDTIRVGGQIVRLHGIDAPESAQDCGTLQIRWACGDWATGMLRARAEGQAAVCEITQGRDRYDRVVARCTVGGEDLGRWMVSEGAALAFRKYSLDYDLDEKGAAVAGRGLHGSPFERPAVFRQAQRDRQQAKSREGVSDACRIKGNISVSSGARIYHLPGQEHYDKTRISTSKGERWFCSEAEARAAGWRRAKR